MLIANSLVFTAPLINNASSIHQIVNNKHSQKRALALKAKLASKASFHSKTMYLFLRSDLKTVILPWTLFGLSHAVAAPIGESQTPASTAGIFSRLPLAIFWLVINLLPFTIGNQSSPTAILEDRLNKPWRPIAAKRITPEAAKKLMLACHFLAYLFSRQTGGVFQCLAIAALGYAYNNLGGGDRSWVVRGLLCALAYIAFGSGAMEVMRGAEKVYSSEMLQWFALLVVVIFAGMPAADIYDQKGDALVGRDTLPLAIGDLLTRCVLAISIFVSSFVCAWFCECGVLAYVLPVVSGLYVAWRTLVLREVNEDRKTYKFWNLWLVGIYCLPLVNFLSS